jgi:hypothetical protein
MLRAADKFYGREINSFRLERTAGQARCYCCRTYECKHLGAIIVGLSTAAPVPPAVGGVTGLGDLALCSQSERIR